MYMYASICIYLYVYIHIVNTHAQSHIDMNTHIHACIHTRTQGPLYPTALPYNTHTPRKIMPKISKGADTGRSFHNIPQKAIRNNMRPFFFPDVSADGDR